MSFGRRIFVPLALGVALLLCASLFASQPANASTSIIAYKSQNPVTINGVVSPGEWTDTPQVTEPTSGITYAFKQNGTGLLFLLEWQQSSTYCYDKWCFGGIEIANQSNLGEMGSAATPTIMILISQGFQNGYDEFVSMGDTTPTPVEQLGHATQSVCALNVTSGNYVAECYRPFHLVNATPYDPFTAFASGSPIEIAFAVGEFSSPGLHQATDMSTYTLTISNQTFTGTASSTTSTATGSPTGPTNTTTQSSQSTQSTSQSSGSGSDWFAGFPGLNLVTLIVFSCVALALGILLGIGVALRARKLGAGK